MGRERFAPAKVNLFLHVGAPAPGGYHPISSLVAFADVGDVVRLRPAPQLGFCVEGRFAAGLGADADNLVIRARDMVLAGCPDPAPAFHLALEKRLPIASGLGGGSSDAAATLRLVADELARQGRGGGALAAMAARLGADVPMCLEARPAIASGRGDVLAPPPGFPDLDAVLVNPLVASPTAAVYGAYDAAGAPGAAEPPPWPQRLNDAGAVAGFLACCRNDLEAPAIALQPAIAEVLAALRAQPQALLARMSGSGATCFALCAGAPEREALAQALSAQRPDWWVQPCRLAGVAEG
ncbi:MAG TPA: 4-(cytidine 5'-diphospho)-2-C-methyl-D-erythritol kinase [Caulobacteraceae bacterium]|nr:4-(cytidine 5'-diphospho)-2-C-methyl-D-erythritol kinase [Caulobacteraceae bacterium]